MVADVLGNDGIPAGQIVGAVELLERPRMYLARLAVPAVLDQRPRAHVVDPPEAVGDVAVFGAQLDGPADHRLGLVEVDAALAQV